ncbi:hypothetical protein [Dyadobacter sp. 3J3]|uniref:hypothetical protein n=1 Tax=Dyadobacter sp. 3J3 TaxID=2606600 RepID=UPI001357472C|nr:hypothetical protein [Dyadobacter sp. 3J3]
MPDKNIDELKQQGYDTENRLIYKEFYSRRQMTAISCWHGNKGESDGMRKLYSDNVFGIAVQSTYRKLKESDTSPLDVTFAKVEYLDYENDYIDPSKSDRMYASKKQSYSHEQEIRGLIFTTNQKTCDDIKKNGGILVEVDLNKLVTKIIVAPQAPSWYLPTIVELIGKYNFTFNCEQSKLYKIPFGFNGFAP